MAATSLPPVPPRTGSCLPDPPRRRLDPCEAPLDGAKRELREETGYEAARWKGLGSFMVNANYGCGTAHFFAAEGARKTAEVNSDDLEHTELVLLSREELLAALDAANSRPWVPQRRSSSLSAEVEQRRPRSPRRFVPVVASRPFGSARAEGSARLWLAQQPGELRGELVDVRGIEVPHGISAELGHWRAVRAEDRFPEAIASRRALGQFSASEANTVIRA